MRPRATELGDATSGSQRYLVARAAEIEEGGRLIVDVGGREIGVFKIDGEFYALLHRCPHLGGPLCLGEVLGLIESDGPGDLRLDAERKMLTCPWHGWEFDMKTGRSYWDPARMRARNFPVVVEPGSAVAEAFEGTLAGRQPGPYTAEVIPVAVEDDYVVVTMRAARPSSESDSSL